MAKIQGFFENEEMEEPLHQLTSHMLLLYETFCKTTYEIHLL